MLNSVYFWENVRENRPNHDQYWEITFFHFGENFCENNSSFLQKTSNFVILPSVFTTVLRIFSQKLARKQILLRNISKIFSRNIYMQQIFSRQIWGNLMSSKYFSQKWSFWSHMLLKSFRHFRIFSQAFCSKNLKLFRDNCRENAKFFFLISTQNSTER